MKRFGGWESDDVWAGVVTGATALGIGAIFVVLSVLRTPNPPKQPPTRPVRIAECSQDCHAYGGPKKLRGDACICRDNTVIWLPEHDNETSEGEQP